MLSHTSAFQGADEQTRRRLFMHGEPALAVSFSDLSPDVSDSGESDIQSDVGVPGMSDSAESDIQSGLRTVMMSDSGESVTWGE